MPHGDSQFIAFQIVPVSKLIIFPVRCSPIFSMFSIYISRNFAGHFSSPNFLKSFRLPSSLYARFLIYTLGLIQTSRFQRAAYRLWRFFLLRMPVGMTLPYSDHTGSWVCLWSFRPVCPSVYIRLPNIIQESVALLRELFTLFLQRCPHFS